MLFTDVTKEAKYNFCSNDLFFRWYSSNEVQVALMLKKNEIKQLNLVFSLRSRNACTNLGVLIACTARRGFAEWLDMYPKAPVVEII